VIVDAGELSRALTEVVAATEGVTSVYEARPIVVGVAARVVEVVVGDAVERHLVLVESDDEGLRIRVSLASRSSEPAAVVCRRVYRAVGDHLASLGLDSPADIAVSIGRVG
jgi:hypothetical protein